MKTQILKRSFFGVVVIALLMAIFLPVHATFAAKKKQYDDWQGVAKDMHLVFMEAVKNIDAGDAKAAYDNMNDAYFGYYEVQGFEKNVMFAISKDRVNHIEGLFRDIKHSLLGNIENDHETIKNAIYDLSRKVYRDAMVLDGVVHEDAANEVGNVVFGDDIPAAVKGSADVEQPVVSTNSQEKTPEQVAASAERSKHFSFFTSFGLLLREGLEAILVCVAIIAYLVKTGNKHLCRWVYWGMLAGLIGSVGLAILINFIFGGLGQELVDGWTMFIAVIVLFWVSNWMLSRSSEEAWENYIHRQINKSINKRNMYGLVGAAFLAVIREGAELILFYKAAFSGGMTDKTYAALGFVAALVILVIVYLVFRFTTVRLPLKPFFFVTSILLYVLCISFMGKGVQELSEAGVISGGTVIPAMNGFSIDELGIYDRAETLIPQIMILIASLWIILSTVMKSRRAKKEIEAIKQDAVEVHESAETLAE